MKKVVYSMLVASLVLFSCGEEKKDDKKSDKKEEVKVEEEVVSITYTVDPAASTLSWNGHKGTDPAGDFHQGLISISEGTFTAENGIITSGSFKINMTSMTETTEGADPKYAAKLIKHLGSEDFFKTAEFPVAELKITGSEGNIVNGILTVMGKEIPVSIPAETNLDAASATVAAEFTVDFSSLALPGMQSEEGAPAEKKISDVVGFTLRLTAKI